MTIVYTFLDFGNGGAQRLTLTLWRHLDRTRFSPALLCVRGAGPSVAEAEAMGVPVRVLGRLRRPRDWGAVPAIARALRALGADAVHVPLYSRASPYVRLAAWWAGVPLILVHEWSRPGPPSRARQWADRLLARLPGTRFVAASGELQGALVAGGVPSERLAVVYSGIDVERFEPRDRRASRVALGARLGTWLGDRPVVVVPARLHPMKGHVDLLAALPALRRQVPDVLVLCVGTGPLARVLPALAASAGLSDVVRFLGQWDDMPLLYGAADVVALPSRVEGLPSAMLEAWAALRPVVATAVGGVPEALHDGVEGRLVPPRDPAAFAAALGGLLEDPDGRAEMARRGRTVVEARFRAEPATRALEAVYARWWGDVRPGVELAAATARGA